mgnify:CR=1 FL=1
MARAGEVGAPGVLPVEGRVPPGRKALDYFQGAGSGGRSRQGTLITHQVDAPEPDGDAEVLAVAAAAPATSAITEE